ncbi:MAG: PP2C family protein-serine/threonine phosphatase [Leptonema sp. (in: bacteria)]
MRKYANILILYVLTFFLFCLVIYYSFKTPVYRGSFFYFFDHTILIAEQKELILKKFNYKEIIFPNKAIIEIGDSKYEVFLKEYSLINFLKIFYLPILFALLSLFFAIWFYSSLHDIYFFIFFILKSFLIYLSLLYVYYDIGFLYDVFLFLFCWFFFSYLNLQVRFIGKSINTFLLLFEATVLSILFFNFITSDFLNLRNKLLVWFEFVLISIFVLFMIYNIYRLIIFKLDKIDKQKIISFIIGNLLGFANLILLFKFQQRNDFIYIMNSLTYPFLIAYSVYRMYLVPSQIIITRSFITGLLTVLFLGIYFSTMYLYTTFFPEYIEAYKFYYDIFFLIMLSLIIEPLRQKLFRIINKKFIIPDKHYILSLMRLSKILSRISRPNLAIEQFLSEVKQVLKLNDCFLLLPKNYIYNIELSPNYVKELDLKDILWSYIKPEKIIATTYIVYSTDIKKRLFNFLYENKILLLIGLGEKEFVLESIYTYTLKFINLIYKLIYKKEFSIYKRNLENRLPKSALLIGYPKVRKKFYVQEIRYLQEIARLATIMMHNMYILFREVEKRKKIRYIMQSGKFQKKFSFHLEKFSEGIQIKYFNQPALSVSGDYIDIIKIDEDHLGVFLGDVSGHGLGTGYLVSSIRSIVHYGTTNHFPLKEIINLINLFLTDRYMGYEFFTLFAFYLEISTGKMEFINAAHPGILIKPKNHPLYKIEKTQKLLGISESGYESYSIQIEPETKLFLFSDGVLETVNPENELYGEQRLINFLNQYHHLPISEITKLLFNELKNFRQGLEFQDDTTFLAIEYNPTKSLLNFILKALGFRF